MHAKGYDFVLFIGITDTIIRSFCLVDSGMTEIFFLETTVGQRPGQEIRE